MPFTIQLVRMYRKIRAKKSVGLTLVLILVAISVVGNATCFYLFERHEDEPPRFADALWYSAVSITTIGYGDYSPKSISARVSTVCFIMLLGLTAFTVFLGIVVDWGTDLALKGQYGMGHAITSDHVLIVNFPSAARVRRLVEELKSDPSHRRRDILIISDQIEKLPFTEENVLFVHGPPLEQDTYERARAELSTMALVLATSYNDANSDAVVASAVSVIKRMSSRIHIVAECTNEKHRMLFDSVQCNAVVPALQICDNLLVQEVNDPGIAQMVDVVTSNIKGGTLFSCEVDAAADTAYLELAKTLLDKDVNILCVNRGSKTFTSFRNLAPRSGDRVIYIGAQRHGWTELLEQAALT